MEEGNFFGQSRDNATLCRSLRSTKYYLSSFLSRVFRIVRPRSRLSSNRDGESGTSAPPPRVLPEHRTSASPHSFCSLSINHRSPAWAYFDIFCGGMIGGR